MEGIFLAINKLSSVYSLDGLAKLISMLDVKLESNVD